MFDKIAEVSLLYDFYGNLLTNRQHQAMALYHEENFSLSEIAEEFSISRQGVHDSLKNAEKALYEYERKLKLVEKFAKTQEAVAEIDKQLDYIINKNKDNNQLTNELTKIKFIIDQLNE